MPEFLGPVVAPAAYTDALTVGPTFPVSYINLVCDQPIYITCFKPVAGVTGKWTIEGEERYIPATQITGVTITNVCGLKIRSATSTLANVQAELAYLTDVQVSGIPANLDVTATVNNPPGTLLRVTFLTAGTLFTTGPQTSQIRAILIGGGGAGSGGVANQAGSGGGAGAYVDTGLLPATPSTVYASVIGAGGAHNGGHGGNTTLTIGAVFTHADYGDGGASGAGYTLGGGGGVGSAPAGGIIIIGESGAPSVTFNSGAYAIGGDGGSTDYGSGGRGAMGTGPNAPTNALGYGSGGGGGVQGNAGSDGAPGLIIIEEYA